MEWFLVGVFANLLDPMVWIIGAFPALLFRKNPYASFAVCLSYATLYSLVFIAAMAPGRVTDFLFVTFVVGTIVSAALVWTLFFLSTRLRGQRPATDGS